MAGAAGEAEGLVGAEESGATIAREEVQKIDSPAAAGHEPADRAGNAVKEKLYDILAQFLAAEAEKEASAKAVEAAKIKMKKNI